MYASEQLIEFLKQAEGFQARAYKDSDHYSIGYGTRASYKDEVIDRDEAERRLREEVENIARVVNSSVHVPLKQHQFDALVSFAYNVGVKALLSSTLLKLLNKGLYDEAANEFKRWVHSGGHVVEGLVNRRRKELRMFKEGVYDA